MENQSIVKNFLEYLKTLFEGLGANLGCKSTKINYHLIINNDFFKLILCLRKIIIKNYVRTAFSDDIFRV